MSKARPRTGNLPFLATSFVGRRTERKDIRERLAGSRLVSLIGPGGVGKTRLSLQVADDVRHLFKDGVFFVDLAPASDSNDVSPTVIHSLGIRDQSNRDALEKVIDQIRDREMLLILDNCEHVISGCAHVVNEILRCAPMIRVLVTTRISLAMTEEYRYFVPPLTVPEESSVFPVDALQQFESIRLLQDRAEAATPGFELNEHNSAAAARLCIQLEGLPLAIELAVARMRTLSLAQIVERLSDRFQLLSSGSRSAAPRQQTLRALVDWSFALCAEAEQHMWARLSVFAGGFDLSAAEGVCAGQLDGRTDVAAVPVLDLLSALVDQSVLAVEMHDSSVRFRMLETIRAYGAEALEKSGQTEEFRVRHRDYFLRLVRKLDESWLGPDQDLLVKKMRVERENLRVALEAATPGGDYQLELIAGLRYRWYADGYIAEGRIWADEVLDVLGRDVEPSAARTKALWVAAWISLLQGDHEAATRRLNECESAAAILGLAGCAAYCRGLRGLAAQLRGDLGEAERQFAVALTELAEANEVEGWLMTSFEYAVVLSLCGRSAEALAVSASALEVCEQRHERWARSYLKWSQGLDHWLQRDFAAAHAAAVDALQDHRVFDQSVGTALMIELLAWIACSTGEFERAAGLIGASRSLWQRTGTELVAFGPKLTSYHRDCDSHLQRVLPARALQVALDDGAARSPTGIIAYALAERGAESRPTDVGSALTRRQLEIAALVSQGLTSREIAATLVLSVRTVESHIENILMRLGFTSRTQVAAWYVGRSAD